MAARKPRPDLVDRDAVEPMVAEAVAAARKGQIACASLAMRTSPMTWPTIGNKGNW